MTEQTQGIARTAQVVSPGAGPRSEADERLEQIGRERLDRTVRRFPIYATFLGIHSEDGRLADGTRDAIQGDISDERRTLEDLESLDVDALSPEAAFEREVALQSVRRSLFDLEVHRTWERRVNAMDEVGDGLFLLMVRDFAPLRERLGAMTERLEEAPRVMEEHKTRLGDRPMRLWNDLELQAAAAMPALFAEIEAAGRTELGEGRELQRLGRAVEQANVAIEGYTAWIRDQLGRAEDDFALGSERYDELVELRALDGLTTDEILEIGEQQLADHQAARKRVAAEVDANASEQEVLARVKADGPPNFTAALEAYRRAMDEARQFVVDHAITTVPDGERLSVMPTPEYLRKVIPFAAYFHPAKFDRDSSGTYIVTPSVDDDPRAMLEHSYASIYNTGIHEAYPGHHVQLTTAVRHPSVIRLLSDAPEFVEGWAMYCEQMMREEGFDTSPEHRLILHTDAIWRACRIILDIRLHRGDLGIAEAVELMVERTGFERPNAAAEVDRYTYTPTYQFSYLLGKVMILRLRDDERRRLGASFSLRRFHDSLLAAGSLPISFHRRLLTAAPASA